METFAVSSEAEMRALGARFASIWKAGDVVLLSGPLGAGKTTFVRGLLEALGFSDPVRSPTYNLIQTFDLDPPVMHADLYRVYSSAGIGLEGYFDDYLCLIEWPENAGQGFFPDQSIRVSLEVESGCRQVII